LLRYETEDDLRYAVLALDYTPNAGSTAPQLADLRLEIDGKAELVTVGAGNALVDSQKRVQQDPLSGRYFTELDGGVMQLLLLSDGAVKPMEAGRWLGLRVLVDDENDPTTTPISISLMAREKTFAPEAADEQLSGVDFNEPVVLWPWMSHED